MVGIGFWDLGGDLEARYAWAAAAFGGARLGDAGRKTGARSVFIRSALREAGARSRDSED